jgi:hypothetical protein
MISEIHNVWLSFLVASVITWIGIQVKPIGKYDALFGGIMLFNLIGLFSTFLYAIWSK